MNSDTLSTQAIAIFTSEKEGTAAIEAYLNNGGHLNAVNAEGQTCLSLVSEVGNVEAARLLIKKGTNINHQDKKGRTALMNFAINGNKEGIKLMLENNSKTNIKDEDGKIAAMHAIENGHVELAAIMIESNPKDLNVKDNNGENIMMKAVKIGHIDTVKFFMEKLKNEKNNTDNNKLQDISSILEKDNIKPNEEKDNIAPSLKSLINEQDLAGNTMLMQAYKYNHPEVFQYLLQNEADIFAKDKNGLSVVDMISIEKNNEFKTILEETLVKSNPTAYKLYGIRKKKGMYDKYSEEMKKSMQKIRKKFNEETQKTTCIKRAPQNDTKVA
jgi:ankyrin repeat protein